MQAGGVRLELSAPHEWRAHVADPDLAKRFAAPEFDDAAWPVVRVPGHWRSSDAFRDADGPVLHRTRFTVDPAAPSARRFLELEGAFYYGDVWLDGEYVGATEGYFVPHAFDVTGALAAGGEHVLAVEVACPPQHDRTAKRIVTGVFSHWDNLDPAYNPGGLWRPVRLRETGPVRIARARVLCTEAAVGHGRLLADLTLDVPEGAPAPRGTRLRATVTGPDGSVLAVHARDVTLAAGGNHLAWTIDVDTPPRWWPRRLGDQPLCDVALEIEAEGAPSDDLRLRTAFREVKVDDWVFTVNGERLFVMGSNQGPTRMALAEATAEEMRRDVELALAANLDVLRLHAHVGRPELYDAADELGLLLWQDLPLQWGYARSIRKQAVRQARVMVDVLGHHPSIVLWCAHNEPLALDVQPGEPMRGAAVAKIAASMLLPTWNKDVLDRSVARAIAKADPTRPVDRHSGIVPGPASLGTDTHWYFGWYHGELMGLARVLRSFPRLARFVSEFGAQAVPDTDDWMEPGRWPDLDWDALFEHHALQRRQFDRYVPPADCKTFDEWREATQAYQAALVQLQVEDLRRLRFSPTGGFLQFCFADGHPSVTWSVLDHARVPKRGYAALRDACRPVLPMLDPRDGTVHVVNELRAPLAGAVVEATIDGRRWRWSGDAPADSIEYVGRVDLHDAVDAEVALEHPAVGRVANRYPLLLLTAARAGRDERLGRLRSP